MERERERLQQQQQQQQQQRRHKQRRHKQRHDRNNIHDYHRSIIDDMHRHKLFVLLFM